eukprot:scaffold96058_cov20-Tisochrysis_lutea.AAC.3
MLCRHSCIVTAVLSLFLHGTQALKWWYVAADEQLAAGKALICAALALEWWYTSAEEHLAAGKALPVPPPPPPPRPSPKGVGLPADTSHCPVCRKACMNPAQVRSSVGPFLLSNQRCSEQHGV